MSYIFYTQLLLMFRSPIYMTHFCIRCENGIQYYFFFHYGFSIWLTNCSSTIYWISCLYHWFVVPPWSYIVQVSTYAGIYFWALSHVPWLIWLFLHQHHFYSPINSWYIWSSTFPPSPSYSSSKKKIYFGYSWFFVLPYQF